MKAAEKNLVVSHRKPGKKVGITWAEKGKVFFLFPSNFGEREEHFDLDVCIPGSEIGAGKIDSDSVSSIFYRVEPGLFVDIIVAAISLTRHHRHRLYFIWKTIKGNENIRRPNLITSD